MTARTVRATPAQVRAAAVPPPPAPVVEAVPPPAAPARKVRRTVDLTAAQHRDLNRFLDEAGRGSTHKTCWRPSWPVCWPMTNCSAR